MGPRRSQSAARTQRRVECDSRCTSERTWRIALSTSRKLIVEAARDAKIMGVRAGTEHRYTGVWVVVVDDRIFARSWNDKPTGWFRAFRTQPTGTIQLDELEIPVRGKLVRSTRIRDAV